MKFKKTLKKLSNVILMPTVILTVCLVVFREELSTFKYLWLLHFLLFIFSVILIISALFKDKK